MKKKLVFLMVLVFALSGGRGLALTTREVVGRVQKEYEKILSLTADFTQESNNKMTGQTQTARGTVYFEKPGRMRWDYASEPKNQWVSDGKTLWFYQPEENQVIVQKVTDLQKERSFLAFLVGEGNLTRDFNVLRVDQRVEEDPKGYRIELTLKQPHAIMDRLFLVIDREKSYVRQADVYDAYGNLTRTLLDNIRVNQKIPDKCFTFVIPPGTEVVENFSTQN
jgi:outer membrane lipoprotein carrier protein